MRGNAVPRRLTFRAVQRKGLFPVQVQLPVRRRAVAQVQVDEALVRNADLLGNRLEVVDRFLVQANGHLLLQSGSVGVLSGGGEVVFFSHGAPSIVGFPFPGGRLACRDDSDGSIVTSIAMADDQDS